MNYIYYKVNSNQAILFGGAINSINEITNDVLIYFIKEKGWIKINPLGTMPSARAAHASICKDELILFTFGGAIKNGSLADNDIHFLEFSKGIFNAEWGIIKLKENKPPKRYGHGMIYSKPFLVIFGGTSDENKCLNDLWIINIDDFENEKIEWKPIKFDDKIPNPRTYFSTCISKGGRTKGMILIFGGRTENKEILNDLWGLRRHRNGDWEWIQAVCKSECNPVRRFQHTMISFTSKLVILGGRTYSDNLKKIDMPIDVFDFEKMFWSNIFNINIFRHSSFLLEKYAFIHGGCQFTSPLEGSDKVLVFDVSYLISQINLKLKNNILSHYQEILKLPEKNQEKSDENIEDKPFFNKSTSRSKSEKSKSILSIEPYTKLGEEIRKVQRKSLVTIKLAIQEKHKKIDKFSPKANMSKIQEEDLSTPVILQKANIASVNVNVINYHLQNSIYNNNLNTNSNTNTYSNKNSKTITNILNKNDNQNNLEISNLSKSPYYNSKGNINHFNNFSASNSCSPNSFNTNSNNLNNIQNLHNLNINNFKNFNNMNFYTSENNLKLNNNVLSSSKTGEVNVNTSSNIKTISLEESNKFKTINEEENIEELYEYFIKTLLKPSEWKNSYLVSLDKNGIPKFRFRREHIIALTKACQEIILGQKMVLKIKTPVKVFGDIHGQYEDLMRFFKLWGEPSENPGSGDINLTDYLFLGDFVDRGVNSLETICLLMALKIKYPEKIHLIRGNHEDRLINSNFGFLEECEFRLNDTREPDEFNVFEVINEFFDCLPLAAIIDKEILCIHGGLGGCLTKISEIEEIKRPLRIVHEANNRTEQIVMDILWSDPTDNDNEFGIQPNIMRDSRNYGNIVKFGPDIVDKFLNTNKLSMIIRAHECVLDGFERFNGGKLITLFSATDYCKRHKNAGAMLIINNNFEIIPHLIYPIFERIDFKNNNDNLLFNAINNIENYIDFHNNNRELITNIDNQWDVNKNVEDQKNNGNIHFKKLNGFQQKMIKWIDEEDDFKNRPPTPLRNKDFVYNNVDDFMNYENDEIQN